MPEKNHILKWFKHGSRRDGSMHFNVINDFN